MGKPEAPLIVEVLDTAAQKCAIAARHADIPEENLLYDKGVTKLRRVASLLKSGILVPQIELFGPPVNILKDELEDAGFEDDFGDFMVLNEVVFVANIYRIQNPLAFIRLLRVPMPDHEGEVSQGLFSRSFNTDHLRLE